MVPCHVKAGRVACLLLLMTMCLLNGPEKAGGVCLTIPEQAQRHHRHHPHQQLSASRQENPSQQATLRNMYAVKEKNASFGPGSRDAALSSSKVLKLYWNRITDLTYVLAIVLIIESEFAGVYQLAGICRLTDVSHGVQKLLRIIMWSHKTLVNLSHMTLRALKFNRWL